MNKFFILSILFVVVVVSISSRSIGAQSTCPVVHNHHSAKCKCGIKTDGNIYIYCARKQLKKLPQFTRSSILYDELILSGNQIKRVNVNSFQGIRVKRLYLDENPLQTIESNSFNELANYLEELVISLPLKNQFESEQIDAESSLDYVSNSQIESSSPVQLPVSLFKNLLNLKVIKLSGLNWSTNGHLTRFTFNRTRKLEKIHLINCNLVNLEPQSLSGVELSLEELNLDNNQLQSTNEVFNEIMRMKRLNKISLSRNKIRSLNRILSSGINSLLQTELDLDLSFNAIVFIDEYAFGSSSNSNMNSKVGLTKSLVTLNLNNNELNQFQLNFVRQLKQLQELHLDYNKIEKLNENLFTNSNNLRVLSLRGNQIRHLSSTSFVGLHFSLTKLNLAANQLESIEYGTFLKCSSLRDLNLERNGLGHYFDNLISLTTPQEQAVHNTLMNVFSGVENKLEHLNMENNQLKPIHLWTVSKLRSLQSLRLGHNQFESLRLEASKAVSNQLADEHALHMLFKNFRNLTHLDLQNSSLRQIPYFRALNNSLTSLNMAENKLCHISAKNLRKFYFKLTVLNLNLNPLQCDCNLISLIDWMLDVNLASIESKKNAQPTKSTSNMNWQCHTPVALHNRYMTDLRPSEIKCQVSNYEYENTCSLDSDFDLAEFNKPTVSTIEFVTQDYRNEEKLVVSTTQTQLNVEKSFTTLSQLLFTSQNASFGSLNNRNLILNQQEQTSTSTETTSIMDSSKSLVNVSSLELKQTLLGSLIGALTVIIILVLLACVFKTTRKRLFANSKDNSFSCTDTDKSNTTAITNTSPYETAKLGLRAPIGPFNLITTNGHFFRSNDATQSNGEVAQIDANKLINRMSFHQNHLLFNTLNTSNNSCIHYLSSNIPYLNQLNHINSASNSSSGSSSGGSTSNESASFGVGPAISPSLPLSTLLNDELQMNSELLLNKKVPSQQQQQPMTSDLNNTYDKLHQQRMTSNSTLRSFVPGTSSNGTLASFHHNLNHLIMPQAQQPMFLYSNASNQFVLANEQKVPFLAAMSDLNTISLPPQPIDTSSQHTYHEIGDMLLKMSTHTNSQATSEMKANQSSMNQNNSNNQSEFYI